MAKQLFTFTKERPDYKTIWNKLPDTYEHKIGMHNDFETKCILYARLMVNEWKQEVVHLNQLLAGTGGTGLIPLKGLNVISKVDVEGLKHTYNPDDVPLDLLLFAKRQKPESGLFELLLPDVSPNMVRHHNTFDKSQTDMATYYNLMYILPKNPTIDYLLEGGIVTIDNRLEPLKVTSKTDMIDIIIAKLADICTESELGVIPMHNLKLTLGEFKLWNT